MTYARVLVCTLVLAVAARPAAAGTAADKQAQFLKALDHMMVEFAPLSAHASLTVRKDYRPYLDLLVLDEYAALEAALWTGGLVPLPGEPDLFNLKPRTDGVAPIAEKDLANQASYISARPATIGALLDVASRVTSGPVEVTSLVRHSGYQEELRTTNSNANTSIPMHTMGLAFDIALVNTPLKRVYEIRDVLRQLQAQGDLLVIGERKQLVFHVVPHPSRLGYYADLYARAAAAAYSGATVLASARIEDGLTPYARAVVDTAIVAIHPTDEYADEWWAANGARSDLTVSVLGDAPPSLNVEKRWLVTRLAVRCVALVAGWWHSARDLVI